MRARQIPGSRSAITRLLVLLVTLLLIVTAVACGADVRTDAGSTGSVTPGATGTAVRPRVDGSIPAIPGSAPGTAVSTPATSSTTSTTTGKGSPTTTATTATPARNRPLSTTTVALVDSSRPTVSRGRQLSAIRSLPTTVVYPTSGGPFPLVVFAHGFQLGPSHYEQIMRAIAAGGYVVAAPSFPLADAAVAGGNVDRGDIPNQSGDLSFVISQLAAGPGDGPAAGGPLAGKIDATRLGAVGHSDGADTVLDLGYYPGRMDSRVMAVAAVSPDAMTGPGGSVGTAPVLISHGDRDTVVPYSNATTVFAQVQARRFLLTLLGGDHLGPAQGQAPWAAVLDRAILELLDRFVAGRTADEQALVASGTVPGVASVAVRG